MQLYHEPCQECKWFYNIYDYFGFNFTTISRYANFTTHYHGYPSFPFNGEFNFTVGVTPRHVYRGRRMSDAEIRLLVASQPRARYTLTVPDSTNHPWYELKFYPPVYGFPVYTKPTFSYRFARRLFIDEYGFRYFNITAFGQRHREVTGYDNQESEIFGGYIYYRDFEGSYKNWFGRALHNTLFRWAFRNPCFNFTIDFIGNSTHMDFNSRYAYLYLLSATYTSVQ